MGSQRARDDAVGRARRRPGARVRWVLLAAATCVLLATGCSGGSDPSQLEAGDSTDAATETSDAASDGGDVAVTLGGSSTTEVGSPTTGQLGASTTSTGAGGVATTTTAGRSRTGTTLGPSTTRAPNVPNPPAGTPTATTTTTPGPAPPRSPQPQTITFPVPGAGVVKYADGRAIGLGATASSQLAVEYYAVGPDCELQGAASVFLLQTGSCTVGASQAGNSEWNPAPDVEVSFTIVNGDSSFDLDAPAEAVFDPNLQTNSVDISLVNIVGSDQFSASGSGACSGEEYIEGGTAFTLSLVATGTCTVTVSQGGNQNFNIGPTRTTTITVT